MSLFQLITRIYIALAVIAFVQIRNIAFAMYSRNPVCKTQECIKLAELYISSMNKDGNPCVDFYDYVCKGWKQRHKMPDFDDVWSVDSEMTLKSFADLRTLLENPIKTSDQKEERAKEVYRTCMAIPHMHKSPSEILKQVMIQINHWPMFIPKYELIFPDFPWWKVDNHYIKNTGKSALFDFLVQADTEGQEEPIIYIQKLISPYGTLQRILPWKQREKTSYIEYLYKLVINVAPYNNMLVNMTINEDLLEVVNFRILLSKIIENNRESKFVQLTIGQLQALYDKKTKSDGNCRINWLNQLRVLYSLQKTRFQVSLIDKVYIDSTYALQLCELLKRTRKRVILNHIHLYFLEKHTLIPNTIKSLLYKSITYGIPSTGVLLVPFDRWIECILDHNMRETLTQMYIKAYFPKSKKEAVKHAINTAKELLKVQIMRSRWLNAHTKLKSINYIDNLSCMSGYPDCFDRPQAEKILERDYMYPLIAGAYMIDKNLLLLTAAYLQWPIYVENMPYAIEFGSLISLIGHELYHVFDKTGVRRSTSMFGIRRWWSRSMCAKHAEKLKCFVNHYNKHRARILNGYLMHEQIKSQTVDEDVPDAMGLKLAYLGFEKKYVESNGTCPVLPGFEKVGCHKLFFIAYAQSFCASARTEAELRYLITDDHSIPSVRVNAAVSNMKEFSAAFDCKTNSPLFARNSCDLWM